MTSGSGCADPLGLVPILAPAPGDLPRLGTTSHIRLSNLPAAITIPIFLVGFSNAWDPDGYALPVDLSPLGWTGCTQLVGDSFSYLAITATGTVDQPIFVPSYTPLGLAFHIQALVLYTPTGIALSNAVTGVVGY